MVSASSLVGKVPLSIEGSSSFAIVDAADCDVTTRDPFDLKSSVTIAQ